MKLLAKLICLLIIIVFTSCNKESDMYKSTGTIGGRDYTMCGCCGGWIIAIDSANYLFDSLPKNSNIKLENETLPLLVKLDWQKINDGCSRRITIQRIKKGK